MNLKEFSEHPAVVESWSKIGPVLTRYMELRALAESRAWLPGEGAEAKGARAKAFADMAEDFKSVGSSEAPPPRRMNALEPEQ